MSPRAWWCLFMGLMLGFEAGALVTLILCLYFHGAAREREEIPQPERNESRQGKVTDRQGGDPEIREAGGGYGETRSVDAGIS